MDEDEEDVTLLSQNKLAGLQAKATLKQLFYFFAFFAGIAFILGVYIVIHDFFMFELKIAYEHLALDKISEINFTLSKPVKKPVYLMYEIDQFYQAHQRFVTLRNNDQLSGQNISEDDIKNCNPSSPNMPVKIPCGVAANTRFNDTFKIRNQFKNFSLMNSDIVFKSDKKIFKDQENGAFNTSDPHFIVWAKPAPFPHFRKAYGIIREDMDVGDYVLEVDRQWRYGKNKKLVLSNKSGTGGKNINMGILFLIVFVISTVLAVIYWFLGFVLKKE